MSGLKLKKKNAKSKKITKLKRLDILLPFIKKWTEMYIEDLCSEEKVANIPFNGGTTLRFVRNRELNYE